MVCEAPAPKVATPKSPDPEPPVVSKEPEVPIDALDFSIAEMEELLVKWPHWLSEQDAALPLVGKYLKNSAITEVSGHRVRLALDPRFKEYIPMLEEGGARKKIEKCIGKLLDGTVNIELTVWDTPPLGSTAEEEPEELVEEGPLVSSAQSEAPKTLHEWGKDPVVKRTLEIFNADILEVNEPS